MQNIRKLFFTYRNGVVADALKSAGDPHRMIFGLQLPQLSQIAREVSESLGEEEKSELARSLWAEKDCRESRLLAAYLFDPSKLDRGEATSLLDGCLNHEEIDILVFRCLRNHPEAVAIKEERVGTHAAAALSRFV